MTLFPKLGAVKAVDGRDYVFDAEALPQNFASTASGDGPASLLSFLKGKDAKAAFVEKGFAVLSKHQD